MREDDFNLIFERWIRVLKPDASVLEVSILELFENAAELRALAGEIPTQDVAVLRLLLAILHAVFSRRDEAGNPAPIKTTDDALGRWEALWNLKKFPVEVLKPYLNEFKDRFWLFDKERPFYQSPDVKSIAGEDLNGNPKEPISAAKLNGEISQSGNKTNLFANRAGEATRSLTYPEAARWLVHLVGYDDCALKKSIEFKKKEKEAGEKNPEGPGVGWLGKLGVVYAEGDNLFETLALNFVLLPDGADLKNAKPAEKPIWEREEIRTREREKISRPDNLAELFTFPSRYVLLERENGKVVGYRAVFGKFFDSDASLEQMTMRTGFVGKKGVSPLEPARHSREKFLWQEFQPIFVKGGAGDDKQDDRRPGVVKWINKLQAPENELLAPEKSIRFRATGIYYGGGSQRSCVEQVETDALTFRAGLVSKLGEEWTRFIAVELDRVESAAGYLGYFARDVLIAESGKPKKDPSLRGAIRAAKGEFYAAMDAPFRKLLASIFVEDEDTEEKREKWRGFVKKTALRQAEALARGASPAAYVGRTVTENKKSKFYSTSDAYGNFLYWLNQLYKPKGK